MADWNQTLRPNLRAALSQLQGQEEFRDLIKNLPETPSLDWQPERQRSEADWVYASGVRAGEEAIKRFLLGEPKV